jgi:hypothetical protein
MKIKFSKNIYAVCVGLALTAWGCNDYLDINTDPTRISEEQVSIVALLPTTMEATSQAQYSYAFTVSQITQHNCNVTGGGADRHEEIRLGSGWTVSYLTAMSNLKIIIDKATKEESPQYVGIAKVLLAYNFLTTTGMFENIPNSQGFTIKNLKPDYDSQESIYAEVNKLLDEALLDLDKTSLKIPGNDDIIFGGNIKRWKAACRVLKARAAMHTSVKDPVGAANKALDALSKDAMIANADDLQLVYNARNLNPWHSNVALANVSGNLSVRHSQQIVDALNGTTWGVFDPRMPIIGGRVAANAGATTWVGGENGIGGGNVDFNPTVSWHSRSTSPIQLVTYAEQKFIQAEAEFLKNGGTKTSVGSTAAAYQAYLDGTRANLQKLGVPDTAITRYMAAPQVAVGAANLTLKNIHGEKFKALFLNTETWNDYRRWDYSTDVFKDLALPSGHNVQLNGSWIQRSQYPLDEITRNGAVVTKNEKPLGTKMWIFTK